MKDDASSYANFSNLELIEDLYQSWLKNPNSVDSTWNHFFEGMQFADHMPKISFKEQASPDLRIFYLITAYRTYGHLMAQVNPIAASDPPPAPELNLENFGLSDKDLEIAFPTCGFLKEETAPLKEILEALKRTYCRTIGIEYMGLGIPEMEKWLQERIEPNFELHLSNEEKVHILSELNRAETFETFIHTKYVGQKRFSLEGAETLIPMLAALLEDGVGKGITEAIIGMAHRGRLNVLANIFGKSYAYIFREFEDHYTPDLGEGTGDVKYHKGFIGKYTTLSKKEIPMTLMANPSHLESVDPVVEGGVRARQEVKPREKQNEIVPILIHGDASIAGQGVIYETMQLSRLHGYATQGTIHIVINNQIGFTTLPRDGRSTHYCTDIAKTFSSPVFHVNAEDPEGCVAATKLAVEMRQKFGCDVFIDLNGYRKYGHNEGDEPAFTQPVEYALIRSKKTIREIYRQQLIQNQIIDEKVASNLEEEFKNSLKTAIETVKTEVQTAQATVPKMDLFRPVGTAVDAQTLIQLTEKFCTVPQGFTISPKIQRLLSEKLQMVQKSMDWAMGELLAYATLCTQKVHVRLSGQDVRRGTFSHRHAIWVDQKNAQKYFPLSHLSPTQAPCDIFNSPLSEYAVLGFEFGYSLLYPNSLVLWEAQYGDFANGAQVIIDQYITSSEQKWGHRTNLTLLLPHGYQGEGPEHSSGRMERFLQMAGNDNMFLVNCTTPAQFFHLLRRQGISEIKRPLVVFSPKVLLRHPLCISPQKDFTTGTFQEILDDSVGRAQPATLLFCSGKIYYDLIQEREKRNKGDLVILRIEQLYPLNEEKLKSFIEKYSGFKECIWAQEEHSNMGAWEFMRPVLEKLLKGKAPLRYVGRDRSAAVAAGSFALHKKQHEAIIQEIFR
ncbi:MAG TPA: 2-oxoglutarate dehydrogenase E1 component [Rhabdochlamydiaceae bacterium]|nr:2-oxoglutarate dehydrogenase E1 component [Rhabdochlamydiaceae bacterium]